MPWRWKGQIPPKHWYPSTKLCGITFQKTVILIPLWESHMSARELLFFLASETTCWDTVPELWQCLDSDNVPTVHSPFMWEDVTIVYINVIFSHKYQSDAEKLYL
jgi:hypothetical protein